MQQPVLRLLLSQILLNCLTQAVNMHYQTCASQHLLCGSKTMERPHPPLYPQSSNNATYEGLLPSPSW